MDRRSSWKHYWVSEQRDAFPTRDGKGHVLFQYRPLSGDKAVQGLRVWVSPGLLIHLLENLFIKTNKSPDTRVDTLDILVALIFVGYQTAETTNMMV